MPRKQNALDLFHEKVCSRCDVPEGHCEEGSTRELACILAAIYFAIKEK